MKKLRIRFTLRSNQEGATAIEFALIAPTLFLLTFAIIEYSMIMFSNSTLEAAVNQVARMGQTGNDYNEFAGDRNSGGLDRHEFLLSEIERKTAGLIKSGDVRVETVLVDSFSDVDRTAAGDGTVNFGGAGEVVLYRVSYDWPILTPMMGEFLGDGAGNFEITSSVIVRNEG